MTLDGRHAVITGGGSGVGAATARAFADAGAVVTVMGRREEPLRAQAEHERIGYQLCDVTDADAVTKAFEAARDACGPVSIVVANAGDAASKPFAAMQAIDLDVMLAVNVTGVFNAYKAALADMQALGWGRMIATASTAGLKGYGYVSGYCAAKHGVVGLTRALADKWAPDGVRVNLVAPGFIRTRMTEVQRTDTDYEKRLLKSVPMRRWGEPADIGRAVASLATGAIPYATGIHIDVGGGMQLHRV